MLLANRGWRDCLELSSAEALSLTAALLDEEAAALSARPGRPCAQVLFCVKLCNADVFWFLRWEHTCGILVGAFELNRDAVLLRSLFRIADGRGDD